MKDGDRLSDVLTPEDDGECHWGESIGLFEDTDSEGDCRVVEDIKRETSANRSLTRKYVEEVWAIPKLTSGEERRLADRYVGNRKDWEARDALIRSSLRIPVVIARKYINCGLPFLDLIEEGNLGLFEAIEKFDPAREYRFSTFASWIVDQRIKRGLSNTVRMIRIPVYMGEIISKKTKIAVETWTQLGRVPTLDELIDIFHEDEIRKYVQAHGKNPTAKRGACLRAKACKRLEASERVAKLARSLDEPIGEDKDGKTFADVWAVDNLSSPEESAYRSELMHEVIEPAFARLTSSERQVMKLRFKADGSGETLKEIGLKRGVTRERIRQIEQKALAKIKAHIRRSRIGLEVLRSLHIDADGP